MPGLAPLQVAVDFDELQIARQGSRRFRCACTRLPEAIRTSTFCFVCGNSGRLEVCSGCDGAGLVRQTSTALDDSADLCIRCNGRGATPAAL